jgi:hypothetical protein
VKSVMLTQQERTNVICTAAIPYLEHRMTPGLLRNRSARWEADGTLARVRAAGAPALRRMREGNRRRLGG